MGIVRDRVNLLGELGEAVIMGLFIGAVFWGVGNDGSISGIQSTVNVMYPRYIIPTNLKAAPLRTEIAMRFRDQ